MLDILRLGTRGSALALAQAGLVRAAISMVAGTPTGGIAIQEFRTVGDRITDRPLKDIGGKALFTREIDAALISGQIDAAVHSLKDVESVLAPGLHLAAVLPRADARDCLIGAANLQALPIGARVGTSAVRRIAQILAVRRDLEIVPMRGNVDTRIRKWQSGEVQALVLAQAGLDRLGRHDVPAHILPADGFLPAAGQGIVGIVLRAEDRSVSELIEKISHAPSMAAALAERAFVAALGGDCGSPIAAHATCAGETLRLEGAFFELDGQDCMRGNISGAAENAADLGRALAMALKAQSTPRLCAVLQAPHCAS